MTLDCITSDFRQLPAHLACVAIAEDLGLELGVLGANPRLARRVLRILLRAKHRGAAIPPVLRIGRPTHAPGSKWKAPAATFGWWAGRETLEVASNIDSLLRQADPDLRGTIESVIVHELGHYAHLRAIGERRYLRMAVDAPYFSPADYMVARLVGRYPASEKCEFVAETWRQLSEGHHFPPSVLRLYRQLGGPALLSPR